MLRRSTLDVKKGLPSEYTQIEYIENVSNAYIDTGYKPNQNTKIQTKIDIMKFDAWVGFFGCRGKNSIPAYALYFAGTDVFYGHFGSTLKNYFVGNYKATGIHNIEVNKGVIRIDTNTHTIGGVGYQLPVNMYLFGTNENNTSITHTNMRLYSFKIWENGSLVRDFVPVQRKSDGQLGLFDLKNQQFYDSPNGTPFYNEAVKPEPKFETVNISLQSNNANFQSLLNGTTFTVDGKTYTYNGSPVTVKIAAGKAYTVVFNTNDRFNKPANQSYTAQANKIRNVTGTYNYIIRDETVNVNLTSSDATYTNRLLGTKITIGSKELIWQGNTITTYVEEGTTYTVTFEGADGFDTPQSETYTAISYNSRSIDIVYEFIGNRCCVYETTKANEKVTIVSRARFFEYIKIKGIDINPGGDSLHVEYTFEKPGTHYVDLKVLSRITDFNDAFNECTSLIAIPENLLHEAINIVETIGSFYKCSLRELPSTLFIYCPKIRIMQSCFAYCTSLKSIPTRLFAYNKNIHQMQACFYKDTALTGETPKDNDGGELWERSSKPGYQDISNGLYCFAGCTNLSNYSEIPSNWK